MARLGRLLAGLAFALLSIASNPVFAAPPTLTCASDASIFNTGYNGAGGKFSPGVPDAHWEAGLGNATGPASVATWTTANVVGNLAPWAWVNSPYGNAEWIARGNGLGDGAGAIVYYRYQFNIDPTVPLATFALQFNFYIDDKIQQLMVNGAEYKNYVNGSNPNGQGGFSAGAQLSEVLSYNSTTAPWVHGANSIIIKSWNSSAPTGLLAQTTATAPCPPLLSITKTAATPGTLMPATDVGYTVTASNTGAVAADGTVVADPLPAGITSGSWTCSATGSAVCPSASGSLPLSQTIATFPAGSAVTYAITARVADVPPASITNTASVTRANAVCTPANCTASTTNTTAAPGSLVINKTIAGGPAGGVSGSFTFAVACSLGGAQPNTSVVLASATSGSTTVNNIPAGAQCTVTEQTPLPAAPAGYAWGTTPAAVTVTIPTGASATASATNQLNPITGSLVISKTVAGGPAGGVSGSFVFAVSCTSGGAQPNVPVVLANATSGSATVAGIPADAQCTVTEQTPLPSAPAGYAWGTTPAPVTVTIPAGGSTTASATNQLSPVVINPVPTLSQWSLLLLSAMLLLMGGAAARQRRG